MNRAAQQVPKPTKEAPNFRLLDDEKKKKQKPKKRDPRASDTFGDVNPILSTGDWDMSEYRALERRHSSLLAKVLGFFYK